MTKRAKITGEGMGYKKSLRYFLETFLFWRSGRTVELVGGQLLKDLLLFVQGIMKTTDRIKCKTPQAITTFDI
jgi:hypothetical protein